MNNLVDLDVRGFVGDCPLVLLNSVRERAVHMIQANSRISLQGRDKKI